MIPWLDADTPFPPVVRALREPNGLLAAGGDLSVFRLLAAYRQGIFPWFSEGEPILWWSPDPRMVLFPEKFTPSRSLAKTLRQGRYEVRLDTAFGAVVQACAQIPRPGQDGTWITDAMRAAYGALHRQGYAHSVETWIESELAGGLYGVAIGRMFYGESMFARRRDASKIAFAELARRLKVAGFGMIDCQVRTAHLASLGAREIPRAEFLRRLETLADNGGDLCAPWRSVASA
ncbi:MAG: leucyl/phenylalanyl-tRNA--protein transferase [Zoogloeaceae bacterium]|jgi:leucyl/phenylalanyl-tRNA--protein transferase|nr:leucyl/phenylalanyl-tRNA--protein transferase [Zoogloeaceae bacterium]